MILKESFRMQNHLRELANSAMLYLSDNQNVMKIKQEHLRSKSNPKAADETIERKRESDMTADNVIELYLDILNEREKLSKAIGRAKADADIDMDAAIAINKEKQGAISRFKEIYRLKSSETIGQGKDFMINAEGNQTPYIYNIRSVNTIDFDRNALKGIVKRLQRESDEVSSRIDLLNVTLEVDYTPKYEVEDSFEDAYEKLFGKA